MLTHHFLRSDTVKKFDFLLIAPTTSNTVAKISLRIADTLLTNAAIMGQKTSTPIYIMPTDFKEGLSPLGFLTAKIWILK
jgi:flavoprotein